jgi:hypothetical protein
VSLARPEAFTGRHRATRTDIGPRDIRAVPMLMAMTTPTDPAGARP